MNQAARTIWLARHGNRIDFVDPHWYKTAARPNDPPLAPEGVAQSKLLAARIAKEKIDHVFCSPFYRAVQTGAMVAGALGRPLLIEHGLCDLFSKAWFPVAPTLVELEKLAQEFPSIDTSHRSVCRTLWPETESDSVERIRLTIGRLLAHYAGNLLLISHGGPIGAVCTELLATSRASVQTPICCLVRLDFDGRLWHLAADGSDLSYLADPPGPI